MPQMSPTLWTLLLLINTTLLLFMNSNLFFSNKPINKTIYKKEQLKKNWKW